MFEISKNMSIKLIIPLAPRVTLPIKRDIKSAPASLYSLQKLYSYDSLQKLKDLQKAKRYKLKAYTLEDRSFVK